MRFVSGGQLIAGLMVILGLGGPSLAQQAQPDFGQANGVYQQGQPNFGQPNGVYQQGQPERQPDLARGERLFAECRNCHELQPDLIKIGPSLGGIIGRRPGSVPAFGYSQGMVNYGASGVVWNPANLDQFLTKPRTLIAGTKMVFRGFRKPADRADLIAYLMTNPLVGQAGQQGQSFLQN